MQREQWKYKSAAVWLFLIGYVFGTVLFHRKANELAGKLIGLTGMSPYLLSMRLLGLIGVLVVLFFIGQKLSRNPGRFKKLLILIPILFAIDLSLIVVPIERIHYVQYGFLTWVAYKAIGKTFPAAMLAFVAGIADEAYQYWVLYGDDRIVYFDWNDIVLNLIGVLVVLVFFLPVEPVRNMPKKGIFAALLFWILAVNLMVFVWNPDRYLVRNDPYKGVSSFWITSEINTNYHVMNASEGLIFLGILLILTIGFYVPIQTWPKTAFRTRD
jgi:hypothetical protein